MRKLILLFLPFLFLSCIRSSYYEKNIAIEDGIWAENNKLNYKVNIDNPKQAYNLYLNLRNGNDYPFSNLYIFMETTYPNGRTELDTLQFLLADKQGRWYGEGLGDIKSSSVMFRYKLLFPMAGEYNFDLQQAMRKEELPGIWDVGLKVEKNTD